ncbi:MAG: DNA polymerase III subunit epsilon [Pseudomonadota bacterium]|nr:DNA polymerase III subunit epsilon [Pseudomonadota bacterium]
MGFGLIEDDTNRFDIEPTAADVNEADTADWEDFEPIALPNDALSIPAPNNTAITAPELIQPTPVATATTGWQAPQRAQHGQRQLILDTETTGINPLTERIIEIGVVEMVNRKPTGNTLHVYLNPEQPVGDSVAIHGITDEFLADKLRFADVAEAVSAFLVGAEIIAHNASFDMNFLEAELRRCGLPALAGQVQVTDTLAIAKRKHAGQKNSLDALVRRYDIKPRDRTYHGALLDAEILADVYLAMTGGQVTLDMTGQTQEDSATPKSHRRFAGRQIPVIAAHVAELAQHDQWLDQLEQGKAAVMSLWRQVQHEL